MAVSGNLIDNNKNLLNGSYLTASDLSDYITSSTLTSRLSSYVTTSTYNSLVSRVSALESSGGGIHVEMGSASDIAYLEAGEGVQISVTSSSFTYSQYSIGDVIKYMLVIKSMESAYAGSSYLKTTASVTVSTTNVNGPWSAFTNCWYRMCYSYEPVCIYPYLYRYDSVTASSSSYTMTNVTWSSRYNLLFICLG